jgi:hypothetical protein
MDREKREGVSRFQAGGKKAMKPPYSKNGKYLIQYAYCFDMSRYWY